MFGLELSADRMEALILKAHHLSKTELQRRQDCDLFCLDWQKDGVWYTAGLRNFRPLFVNMRFEPHRLMARDVVTCLGSPQWYQAWYDSCPRLASSSLLVTLVFSARTSVAYCSQYFTTAAEHAPPVHDGLPVRSISLFGAGGGEDVQTKGRSKPWPGDWQALHVDTILHREVPVFSDRSQAADTLPVSALGSVLEQIDQAFAGAPRPVNEDLLHPDAHDDSDIQGLLEISHWRDLPDASIENGYEALAFLSPAGFRHFLPAYMSWVLRHPNSGAAAVGSTIFALTPVVEGPLRSFMISKFNLLDGVQKAAVVSFLRMLSNFEDVRVALDYWDPRPADGGTAPIAT
jgi:hypothetical protein